MRVLQGKFCLLFAMVFPFSYAAGSCVQVQPPGPGRCPEGPAAPSRDQSGALQQITNGRVETIPGPAGFKLDLVTASVASKEGFVWLQVCELGPRPDLAYEPQPYSSCAPKYLQRAPDGTWTTYATLKELVGANPNSARKAGEGRPLWAVGPRGDIWLYRWEAGDAEPIGSPDGIAVLTANGWVLHSVYSTGLRGRWSWAQSNSSRLLGAVPRTVTEVRESSIVDETARWPLNGLVGASVGSPMLGPEESFEVESNTDTEAFFGPSSTEKAVTKAFKAGQPYYLGAGVFVDDSALWPPGRLVGAKVNGCRITFNDKKSVVCRELRYYTIVPEGEYVINTGLAEDQYHAIAFDASGNAWIATKGEITKYSNGIWSRTTMLPPEPAIQEPYYIFNTGLSNEELTDIQVDTFGRVWFFPRLWMLDERGWHPPLIDPRGFSFLPISIHIIEGRTIVIDSTTLYEIRDNSLQMLFQFSDYIPEGARTSPRRLSCFYPQAPIPTNQVMGSVVDASGNLWIATYGAGLLRIKLGQNSSPTVERFSMEKGLATPFVTALAVGPENSIYVAAQRDWSYDPQY